MTTCPSCQGANCERTSVVHAKNRAASPHLAPPEPDRAAGRLGWSGLVLLLPAALHSSWWLAGTAVLGLASLTARPIERKHHAQALADWARSCICLDCGASWMSSDFGDEMAPGAALPGAGSRRKGRRRSPDFVASRNTTP